MYPVDPVVLNIPDYFTIIANPMDIFTVQKKLNEHEYGTFDEFNRDVKLIWSNAITYNPKHSAIYGWTMEI